MNVIAEQFGHELQVTQPVRKLYFELGVSLYRQGQYGKAMEHLGDALGAKDGSVEDWKIYNMLHDVCREMGEHTAAKENLLKVIATAPPHIADALARTEKPDHITVATDGTALQEQVLLLQGKACLLKNEGKANEAAALLQQALAIAAELKDGDVERSVLLDLAELWMEQGAPDKAAEALQVFTQAQDKELNRRWQVLQGKCYLQQQNIAAALAIAQQLTAEDDAFLPAHLLKLQAWIVDRAYKEALGHVHHLMAAHTLSPELIFYKVEILLEGNINLAEGIKLLQQLKEQHGIEFIKSKIAEPHIRYRPQHGNDNFFLAQVYKTLIDDFSVAVALEQADRALQENVHFEDYNYPHGAIYQLKAELYELQQNYAEAARYYYLSGKEYYWNLFYKQAQDMFAASYKLEKEKHLESPLIDNYWYYADSLVQLSYTQIDPFVDKGKVEEAATIWYEAYNLQKPSYNDAWAYLTATLIHEQLAKLPDRQKQEELFYGWFYAEHNILIDNTNPKAWGFISRAFSGNGLDWNATMLSKKAYALDREDPFIWEETAIALLNTGQWAEADGFLQKLIDNKPTEVAFIAYRAMGMYHMAQYEKALELMNKVMEGRPDWMWARNLRVMINWMLHNKAEVIKDAEWIWERRNQPEFTHTTTHEFAYAAFCLGYEKEALDLFGIAPDDTYTEKISSLFFYCIYYALKKDEATLQSRFKEYGKAARYHYNLTELRNAYISLCPERKDLIDDLEKAAANLPQNGTDLVAELHLFSQDCAACSIYGSIGWEAIHLSFFRLNLEEGQWQQAAECCRQFQLVENSRVDKYHLWNRLYLALKDFFSNNPKAFLQPGVRQQVRACADASPYNHLEALADLYVILAITGCGADFTTGTMKSQTAEMYKATGVADALGKVDEWLKTCADLLPELGLQPPEATGALQDKLVQCIQCGTEIISRSQKYCFACGAKL